MRITLSKRIIAILLGMLLVFQISPVYATDSNDVSKALYGTWTGTYWGYIDDNPVERTLDLVIDYSEDGIVEGVARIDNGNSGEYLFDGYVDYDEKTIIFYGTEWIKDPLGMSFSDFNGTISIQQGTIEGYLDGDEDRPFSIKKVSNNYTSPRIDLNSVPREWEGEYDGSSGDTVVRRNYEIHIKTIEEDGDIEGVAIISPSLNAPMEEGENGSYYFSGEINARSGFIELQGYEWIEYPASQDDFTFVKLYGFIDLKTGTISGYSDDGLWEMEVIEYENIITEDDLFYEYSKYLRNKGYEKSIKAFQKEMYKTVAGQSEGDVYLAIMKSNFSGLATTLNNILNRFTEKDKREISRKIALEYVQTICEQPNATKFFSSDEFGVFEFSEEALEIIENGYKTIDEKRMLAKELAENSEELSEGDILKVIKEVDTNWEDIDNAFKTVDFVVKNAEVITFIFSMILVQEEVITDLRDNIDKDSALYLGLSDILKYQDDAALAYVDLFVKSEVVEMIVDASATMGVSKLSEVLLGFLTRFAEPHVFSSATIFIAGLTYKALQVTLLGNTPDLEDVEASFITISNQKTLESAVLSKQSEIMENYQEKNGKDVKKLKSEYELLYNTYLTTLEKGYDYVIAVADDKEKKKLEKKYEACENAMSYEKYIKSCLNNARISHSIEYRVEDNKAYITGIDLSESGTSTYALRRTSEDIDLYSIDIPERVDDYSVAGIDEYAFSDLDNVEIIDIPNTVRSIGLHSFAGCDNLHSVYMEEGLSSIDEGAFKDCISLNEIEIPESVTDIHEDAFVGISEINIIAGEHSDAAAFAKASPNATFEIKPAAITGISIVQMPEKTSFGMSEQLDTTGLQIEAKDSDGNIEIIDSGFYCTFIDKQLGTTTVSVNYESFETTYEVEITADECEYLIVYEDENGREIKEPTAGRAMAGTDITLEAPEIEGYTADEAECVFTIGAENTFVITYTSIPKIDIEDLDISYETSAFYTGKQIKPEVKIIYEGKTLKESTDYSIEYGENTEIGTGEILIYGENSFGGVTICYFDIIEKADCQHVWNEVVTAPTCTEKGYTTYTCKNDPTHTYVGDYVDATGHKYGEYKTTAKAKFGKAGEQTATCSACNDKIAKPIAAPKTIKLSYAEYTYNGKAKKPTVKAVYDTNGDKISSANYKVSYASGRKNVGKYKVTVTFNKNSANYTGNSYTTFKINPKGTSISKLTKVKKGFTVKWKKQTGKMAKTRITGYQYRYSTSSKMTKATIKTVKGYGKTSAKKTALKAKKKYFVQVRTYKTVNGTKYYSPWSKAKTIKTK